MQRTHRPGKPGRSYETKGHRVTLSGVSYSGRHHYNSRGARAHRGMFGHPISVASVMGPRGRLLGTGLWQFNRWMLPGMRDMT